MTRLRFLLTSLLASVAALIGLKRKKHEADLVFFEFLPDKSELNFTTTTYSLAQRFHNGRMEYQWRNETEEFSPVFSNMEDAMNYKKGVGHVTFVENKAT